MALAGPIKVISNPAKNPKISEGISSLIGNPYSQPENAGSSKTLAYYETFPVSSFLDITQGTNKVSLTTEAVTDVNGLVMSDYVSISKGSADGSDLGLRVVLANEGSRAAVSAQLADSNLIQTGDILVSLRPKFSQSLRYLTLQLLSTHVSTAVVTTDKSGKKVVYNIDMPMDGDMLGGAEGLGYSKLDAPHFTGSESANLALHVLRPRLNNTQKKNMQQWLELALKRAREKSIYPSKISFNTNYESPMFRSAQDLVFVGDTGRLLLSGAAAKPTQHLQMYCSEYAWTLLSLRDCDPSQSSEFSKNQPSCIKPIFNPMIMFGSGFSSGTPAQEDLYGMTDGVMLLAKQTGRDVGFISSLINQAVPANSDVKTAAPGLSSGHREVAKMMAPLIAQANPYFNQAVLSGQAQMIDGFRAQLNPNSMRNYSPTAFVVHAMMPSVINGQAVTQKAFDYVATIKYVPASVNAKDVQALRATEGI